MTIKTKKNQTTFVFFPGEFQKLLEGQLGYFEYLLLKDDPMIATKKQTLWLHFGEHLKSYKELLNVEENLTN